MFTPVTYFSIAFSSFSSYISPWIPDPANGRLVGMLGTAGGVYRYGVFLILNLRLDSSLRLPVFEDNGKSPPNFAKNLTVPSFADLS